MNIERIMNNLPSNTWESSMCVTFCLPASQDTTSAIIAAQDTIDFSFHFFTTSNFGRGRTNISLLLTYLLLFFIIISEYLQAKIII